MIWAVDTYSQPIIMNTAFVLGNGKSRLAVDLSSLRNHGKIYGCNALYRDFMPEYLISMDLPMVKEILESDIHLKTKFYTQHDNQIDEIAKTEPINFFWGFKETNDSGNSALRLALENKHEICYMIGFDYEDSPANLPNVYQGTPNYVAQRIYPAASMTATKWLSRLRKICRDHPDQKIVRVSDRHLPVDVPNYSEITKEQFKAIYDRTN